MIQIIAGKKGKGKTKHLLDKVNAEVKEVHGNIVYLDKSSKHMYELNNKVRLIDTSEFGLSSSDGFIGFICGIISQDHDLEQMYLDSFLKIAKLEDADITETIDKLDELGEKYNITFVLSISLDADDLPENAKFCLNCGERIPVEAGMVICPNCGKSVPKAKFCPECGHKFGNSCPNCGASLADGAKFCMECGTKL